MNLQYIYASQIFIKIEKIVTSYTRNPSKNWLGRVLSGILLGCSYLFRAYMALYHFCYRYRIFSVHKSQLPVISIGNITVGGSGKTLFTSFLVTRLSDIRCAVSLQGYRSVLGRRRIARRVSPDMSAKYCGDEALLMAKQFQASAIFSGRDRIGAARLAKRWGASCLILDDGLQHYKIHRDIHVIMMQSDDLFGRNAFLPLGYLRQHPKHLQQADLIVIHESDRSIFQQQVRQIRAYSSAPIIGTEVCISKIIDYHTRQEITINTRKVGIFCGIGNPNSFIHTVQSFGYEIIREFCIADHEEWQAPLLEEFSLFCKSRGAVQLLCTEKDAARLSKIRLELPIGVVCASIQITTGQSEFTQFLHRIRSLL